MNAQDRADLEALAELDARPTAGQRVVRTGGQGLSAYVVMDAAEAFNWFGVADWSPDQMQAAMALTFAVIATLQNLGPLVWRTAIGWWKARQPGG